MSRLRSLTPQEAPVDRREALKKVAAGGAVAAGGHFVLSSFDVAAAASAPGIGGLPDENPFLVTSSGNTVTIAYQTQAVTCTGDEIPTTEFQWEIINFTGATGQNPVLEVLYAGTAIASDPGDSTSDFSSSYGSVTLQRSPGNLNTADVFEIRATVLWTCGTNQAQAVYSFVQNGSTGIVTDVVTPPTAL
jgi:hypothetical protein